MLMVMFFFLLVSVSLMKYDLLKMVILLEFLYMVIVFMLLQYSVYTYDFLICVMMFSAGESIFVFCVVMVYLKSFQVLDKVYFFFLVSLIKMGFF